jgi:hypothetical protein
MIFTSYKQRIMHTPHFQCANTGGSAFPHGIYAFDG